VIFVVIDVVLQGSWPRVIRFTRQGWLALTLGTLVLFLVDLYCAIRPDMQSRARAEIFVCILLCAAAVRGIAQERSIKSFADLLGATIVSAAAFDIRRKVSASRRECALSPSLPTN
jgi:hypothetical protein